MGTTNLGIVTERITKAKNRILTYKLKILDLNNNIKLERDYIEKLEGILDEKL